MSPPAREDITILIATGLHRPNLGDEIVELVGPWAYERLVAFLTESGHEPPGGRRPGQLVNITPRPAAPS
jgi:nickel-dependent lactate racemase